MNHFEPTRHQKLVGRLDAWNARIDGSKLDAENLSSKVIALVDSLLDYRPQMTGKPFLGIIFVERRLHVDLLVDLLSRHTTLCEFLKPIRLVGHGGASEDKGMRSKTVRAAMPSRRRCL